MSDKDLFASVEDNLKTFRLSFELVDEVYRSIEELNKLMSTKVNPHGLPLDDVTEEYERILNSMNTMHDKIQSIGDLMIENSQKIDELMKNTKRVDYKDIENFDKSLNEIEEIEETSIPGFSEISFKSLFNLPMDVLEKLKESIDERGQTDQESVLAEIVEALKENEKNNKDTDLE